jgi:hypothetical protein
MWLTAFLDGLDRFLGDAELADQTLFPHAFGLRTPAPLWTVPAFERCLRLSLAYPAATIFLVWAVSGHVGAAEKALGLNPNFNLGERGFAVIGVIVFISCLQRSLRSTGWNLFAWVVLTGISAAVGAWSGSPLIVAAMLAGTLAMLMAARRAPSSPVARR